MTQNNNKIFPLSDSTYDILLALDTCIPYDIETLQNSLDSLEMCVQKLKDYIAYKKYLNALDDISTEQNEDTSPTETLSKSLNKIFD